MPIDEWDASADWYDANMGESGDPLNRDVIRPALLDMLGLAGDPAALKDRTVIDAGCGSGYVAAELARASPPPRRVLAFDAAPRFVELGRKKYGHLPNLTFDVADTRLPTADRAADVVLSKMVLQYVPDIAPFAREARRVLRPGGRLLVVVEHPFHPKHRTPAQYFDSAPDRKLSLWGRVQLTWYPRTVSDYVQAFLSAGFVLTEMRELAEEKEGSRLPRVLALAFS